MKRSDLKLLSRALMFAAQKHRDQRRKDQPASPYINHPINLMEILIHEAEIDRIDVLCAALLHDTVEDTETTEEELREIFGGKISRIVMEVTDDCRLGRQQRKDAQVAHAPSLSTAAKAVKLADKISNLRDLIASPPVNWSLERRQDYFDWAKDVIDGLRGEHLQLEDIFDQQYNLRPKL